ncbi:MAG: YfhO family protein [Bacteroidota bacterium]
MIKNIVPHLVALVTFVVLSVAFFAPQLQGKVLRQGDTVQNRSMANEHKTYQRELGEPVLWTNSMFGGMPTYQISTNRQGNFLRYAERTLRLGFAHPIGYFLMGMICFYILMMSLKINPWIALAGSIAFGFTTNNFVLYEAGHLTKIQSIAYIPLIAAGMINAFKKKYLLGGMLFALGVGLNIYANHVQMTYYFFLTLLIYGIAQLIVDAKNGKIADFAKAVGVLLIAGVIGIGSSAVNLLTTYEYSKDTMRGAPILEKTASVGEDSQRSSEVEGLAWDYAMNWSNGTLDLFSTFIPRVVGGASNEKLGSESATYKALRRRGAQLGDNIPVPLYWGKLNSTSGAPYFGAIIVFLFILGLIVVKGPVKWWLGLGVLLTFMLSMGKHLEGFNHFLFDTLPLLNKFRTPNSVLSVTAAMMPILAMLGLVVINKETDRKTLLRQLYIATGIAAGIAAIFALFGTSLLDFSSPSDANVEQLGYDLKAVKEDRMSSMRSDAFRSLGLVLVAAGLLWAYLTQKIKFAWVVAGIAVMTFFDLWTVDRRYIKTEDFLTQRNYEGAFEPRPVDQQIMGLEKNRGAYRVFDVSSRSNPFENASASYYHNTLGGYHPAKLQRIQDVIIYHMSGSFNQKVLDMFNTKYFIVGGQQGAPQLQQNPAALGNAWFVDTINFVPNANAEIEGLNDFNPRTQVVVHEEFKDYLSGFAPNGQGTIAMDVDSYRPDQLTYQSNSSSEQLAVFSEVWYGPDKGWNTYIDGQKVEHIRVNYILRALRIPAGQHEVKFVFEPSSFYTGRTISQICSLLILLGLIGYIAYFLPPKLKELQTAKVEETTAPKKVAPKSKRRNK